MAFVSGNGRRAYARPSPLFCPGIEKALIEHIHDMLRANALLTVGFLKPITLQAARGLATRSLWRRCGGLRWVDEWGGRGMAWRRMPEVGKKRARTA